MAAMCLLKQRQLESLVARCEAQLKTIFQRMTRPHVRSEFSAAWTEAARIWALDQQNMDNREDASAIFSHCSLAGCESTQPAGLICGRCKECAYCSKICQTR